MKEAVEDLPGDVGKKRKEKRGRLFGITAKPEPLSSKRLGEEEKVG